MYQIPGFGKRHQSAKKCFPNIGFSKRFELVNSMSHFDMDFPRFEAVFGQNDQKVLRKPQVFKRF